MYKTIHNGYSRNFYEPENFRDFMRKTEGARLVDVRVKEPYRNSVFVYRLTDEQVSVVCRFDDIHHESTIRIIGKKRAVQKAQKTIEEGERKYHMSKLEQREGIAAWQIIC